MNMNKENKLKKDSFIIEDFLHKKKFSSFLPGIAGVKGKPLWVFYANVGQCIGGFGVDSKETPIAPFDSAYLAYQNIPFRGFNTALEINGKVYRLFDPNSGASSSLEIHRDSISISEETKFYLFKVTYSTLVNKDFGCLLRSVSLVNKSKATVKIRLIDGLTVMLPYGLSNYCFQNLSTLMSSYCNVELNNDAPFMTFKGGEDSAQVKKNSRGNAYFAVKNDGKNLKCIVDPDQVFVDGITSKITFDKISQKPVFEGQIPCGMVYDEFLLESRKEYNFISLYGSFESIKELNEFKKNETFNSLVSQFKKTSDLIESLISVSSNSSNKIFDEFVKQSFFDNALRGGFPLMIGNKSTYVFSRKHGDMERDYNEFEIPSSYYSAGPGNFRDVNQNRRSDLYIEPRLFDSNIYEFFSLIQLDGYNPLIVKPKSYSLNAKSLQKFSKKYAKFKYSDFSLSQLYSFIKENKLAENDFEKLVNLSKQNIEAFSKEGYWIDHWTYNTDLLENFISVYPDKFEKILKEKKYPYFNSAIQVQSKEEKYCVVDKKVRQYNAVKEVNIKSNWLKDKNNKEIRVSLQSKILNLILIKSLSLDSNQLGIEMEAGRPGWNDALNGLPGLFGSSMNETIELARLAKLYKENISGDVEVLLEQGELFYKTLKLFKNRKVTNFELWDKSSSLRDEYRRIIYKSVDGIYLILKEKEINEYLKILLCLLEDSIKRAKEYDIVPTYFINEVDKYIVQNGIVKVESFKTKHLNEFLEVYTHLGKLGDKYFTNNDYRLIKTTDIFDKKLNLYKTCGSIEKESFELGRIRSFSPGWLERECAFLHMSYKYLVALFDSKQYDVFYKECSRLLTFTRNEDEYGRNPIEASSFIAPSCNKNKKLHGQGFFARLTGANAEVIDLFYKTFIGPKMFKLRNNHLFFNLEPRIPVSLFKNNIVEVKVFSNKKIIYKNPHLIAPNKIKKITYAIGLNQYDELPSKFVKEFRDGSLKEIEVIIN